MNVLSLFDGISCGRIALERAAPIECVVINLELNDGKK
jgi:hypothetical protein